MNEVMLNGFMDEMDKEAKMSGKRIAEMLRSGLLSRKAKMLKFGPGRARDDLAARTMRQVSNVVDRSAKRGKEFAAQMESVSLPPRRGRRMKFSKPVIKSAIRKYKPKSA